MTIVIIIVTILLLLALMYWIITVYNKVAVTRVGVQEAFSTMDVYLVKRYDLIPNLVETIKGYANHEHETLAEVIKFRNMNTNTTEERLENENNISSAISRLMVVIENYPELKANTNFLSLQSELKSIEEEIEKARKYYNGYVRNYNEMIVVVPTCIVANMLGFKKEPFFETTPESRENVKVEF